MKNKKKVRIWQYNFSTHSAYYCFITEFQDLLGGNKFFCKLQERGFYGKFDNCYPRYLFRFFEFWIFIHENSVSMIRYNQPCVQ